MEKFWIYFLGTIVIWYPQSSNGYLNVFINHKEVMKLMGKWIGSLSFDIDFIF